MPHKVGLFALSIWLALPMVAHAVDGEKCTSPGNGIGCYTICDKAAAGAFTCEFAVPGGGKNLDLAIIRAYKGNATEGCGYDDVSVYTVTDTNGSETGYEKPLLGLLDDDGSSSGVKQILNFGPIGPYIYVAGTATDGTPACSASAELHIQLLLYFTQRN